MYYWSSRDGVLRISAPFGGDSYTAYSSAIKFRASGALIYSLLSFRLPREEAFGILYDLQIASTFPRIQQTHQTLLYMHLTWMQRYDPEEPAFDALMDGAIASYEKYIDSLGDHKLYSFAHYFKLRKVFPADQRSLIPLPRQVGKLRRRHPIHYTQLLSLDQIRVHVPKPKLASPREVLFFSSDASISQPLPVPPLEEAVQVPSSLTQTGLN
jgi:hypothetical protein